MLFLAYGGWNSILEEYIGISPDATGCKALLIIDEKD
jgi:hypothetical protein